MRGYDMLRAISELDDELVAEADGATRVELSKYKRWRTYYIGSMAAGLLCICLAGVAIYQIRYADNAAYDTAGITATTTELAAATDTAVTEDIAEAAAVEENAPAESAVGAASSLMEAGDADEECNLPTQEADQDAQTTDAVLESWNEPLQEVENDRWADYTVIAALTTTSGSVACYKAADNGEAYCTLELQYAINQYEQYDGLYAYEICIDVFSDGELIEAYSEESSQQLEYLQSLGLDVWQNEDGGISGILTAKAITEFEGSADYGYALRFANEY